MTDESNVQPLSTDDLRANASKWSLAGDVGLLAHLEEFSNNIFQKAETTENALNNLIDRVEEVTTNFSNVSNQFQSLHNSQFLENRVYDDETPTEDQIFPMAKQVDETQQQVLTKYKDAVASGLQLLDTHFEQVELPQSSDSEDEPSDRGSSLLLKPKVAYTKPLPLIIGSAEWWADDTVGLGEFLENAESEPEFSNSESPPHAIEKRIRLSSSTLSYSSGEVEVDQKNTDTNLSCGLVPTIDKPDQLFAPITMHQAKERGSGSLFGGNPNLFDDNDDDGLFDKPPPLKSLHSHPSSSNVSDPSVKDLLESNKKPPEGLKEKIFFGEDEVDDTLLNSEEMPPDPLNSKVPSEFTKELFAKLGNVAKNQNQSPNVKTLSINEGNQLPSKTAVGSSQKSKLPSTDVTSATKNLPTKKKDELFGDVWNKKPMGSGLFDNDSNFDDDDFLFGSKTAPVRTVSSRPLAVPSKLFDDDDEENDLSPIAPIQKNKTENSDTLENKNVKILSESLSKKPKSTNIFSDNLFSDDLEDDLFSAISKPPFKAVFPHLTVTSDTNSPVFVEPGLKSSTPAVGFSTSDDNLFGSISRLEKVNSSGESEVSANNSENLLEHPSNDDARIESVQYDSRDLGFIETSDISENHDSPANWFQPQFSSTRAAAVTNETSGYKTVTIGPSVNSAVTSSSTENSSVDRINQKISGIAEEADSISHQKHPKINDGSSSSTSLRKDKIVENNKNISSASDHEEPDDLFKYAVSVPHIASHSKPNLTIVGKEKSSKKTKQVKPLSLFDDEVDDLFSSILTVNSNIAPDKPVANSSLIQDHSKPNISKSSVLFSDDVEDSVLFGDGSNKPQDNVSISSGRSSIFDEPTTGKSTLPTLFGDKPSSSSTSIIMKTSLFEDVDDDIDLFSNKKPLENKSMTKSKKEFPSKNNEIQKDNSYDPTNILFHKKHTSSSLGDGVEKASYDDVDLFSNKKPLENKSITMSKKGLPTKNDELQKVNSYDGKSLLINKKYTPPTSHKDGGEKMDDDDNEVDLFSSNELKDDNKSVTISKQEWSSKNDSKSLLISKKPTPPSSLNIRKPISELKSSNDGIKKINLEDVDDDIDLFSNKKLSGKLNKTENKLDVISKELYSKNDSPNVLIKKNPTSPLSLNVSTQSNDLKSNEGDGDNVKVAVTKKIGKLNIPSNLKINTSALLPGAKLVKPTDIVADTEKDKVPLNFDSVDAAANNLKTGPKTIEQALSVSDHILSTSLKDRVRISVKRRPQSRRARQDALRTSGIDFSPTEDSSSISPSSAPFTTPPQNIVSPSTDEEDFHVPELDLSNEKDEQNIFNDVLSNREVTSVIDDSLLFNSAPVISPAEDNGGKKKFIKTNSGSGGKSSDLFQTSGEDNDLFHTAKPISTEITGNYSNLLSLQKGETKNFLSGNKFKSSASGIKSESLFADADEDDDIFSRKSTSALQHTAKPTTVLTLPKQNLDNISQPFLDPLGLLKESKD